PSGPIAGSRSGRETLISAGGAPRGGASPPFRPQPPKPSAGTSAPIAAIRGRGRADEELNSGPPPTPAPEQIRRKRRQRGEPTPFRCGTRSLSAPLCQGLKPPVRLPAHILRGGAAMTGAAFHRIVDGEHREHVLGNALLDRLHGGERQLVERNI